MSYLTVDAYLKNQPEANRIILNNIRTRVKRIIPNAEDSMGYGVPAFRLKGKAIIYYAGFARHIGIYPNSGTIIHEVEKLGTYKTSKGTIQLPLDSSIPYDLIETIVKKRLIEMTGQSTKK